MVRNGVPTGRDRHAHSRLGREVPVGVQRRAVRRDAGQVAGPVDRGLWPLARGTVQLSDRGRPAASGAQGPQYLAGRDRPLPRARHRGGDLHQSDLRPLGRRQPSRVANGHARRQAAGRRGPPRRAVPQLPLPRVRPLVCRRDLPKVQLRGHSLRHDVLAVALFLRALPEAIRRRGRRRDSAQDRLARRAVGGFRASAKRGWPSSLASPPARCAS